MPINFSRNKSSAKAFEGTTFPVVPAVEDWSLSGDEACSPREIRCHEGGIGIVRNRCGR